jgi:hypothetical protein
MHEEILRIPQSHIMSVDNDQVEVDPRLLSFVASDPLLQRYHQVSLALLLHVESQKMGRSRYAPFIETLPATYNMPLFWSLEDLKPLNVSVTVRPSLFNLLKGLTYALAALLAYQFVCLCLYILRTLAFSVISSSIKLSFVRTIAICIKLSKNQRRYVWNRTSQCTHVHTLLLSLFIISYLRCKKSSLSQASRGTLSCGLSEPSCLVRILFNS